MQKHDKELPEGPTMADERWMRHCLALARAGAGSVSPNPMVGAVLVSAEGEVLGEGYHAEYGGPHAEVNAVQDADRRGNGSALGAATLYVNLEPCNHHGKTPPCTALILERGIPRVAVGMQDPADHGVPPGSDALRRQGVRVVTDVLRAECARFNEAFLHHLHTGRPLVTLKIAQTLDGFVAASSGNAEWISCAASRALVHAWRAASDGVLVGAGTARADDPRLTVRHVEGRHPMRIVLDRTGQLTGTLRLLDDEHAANTLAIVAEDATPVYGDALHRRGGRVWQMPLRQGHLDLNAVLERLGREGLKDGRPVQTLLVEAGPGLSTALLVQDLVDRVCIFVAPRLLGSGISSVGKQSRRDLRPSEGFVEHHWSQVGDDVLFQGYFRHPWR